MTTALEILAQYKSTMKQKFMDMVRLAPRVPPHTRVPLDPEEAMRMGILIGRKEGYSMGLVDGTTLGLDVGVEAVDAMLSQPVIFGSMGVA